jgi:hypothetical protein
METLPVPGTVRPTAVTEAVALRELGPSGRRLVAAGRGLEAEGRSHVTTISSRGLRAGTDTELPVGDSEDADRRRQRHRRAGG